MKLAEMAAAIRNHVVDGLKGVSNEAFSSVQLMDEILLETAATIQTLVVQGSLDVKSLQQRVDGIELNCADLSKECSIQSFVNVPRIVIPQLLKLKDMQDTVDFLGTIDRGLQMKIYFDADYKFHKHNLVTKDKPYAFIDINTSRNGMHDVYFFNLGNHNNLKFVTITALYDNPMRWLKTPYKNQFENSEFYAPMIVQKQVIDTLTQKYVNYYRQLNTPLQPNTQETR